MNNKENIIIGTKECKQTFNGVQFICEIRKVTLHDEVRKKISLMLEIRADNEDFKNFRWESGQLKINDAVISGLDSEMTVFKIPNNFTVYSRDDISTYHIIDQIASYIYSAKTLMLLCEIKFTNRDNNHAINPEYYFPKSELKEWLNLPIKIRAKYYLKEKRKSITDFLKKHWKIIISTLSAIGFIIVNKDIILSGIFFIKQWILK